MVVEPPSRTTRSATDSASRVGSYRQSSTETVLAYVAPMLKPDLDVPDEAVTLDAVKRALVIAGSPRRVLDQLVALREEVGHFGTLLMSGQDWDQPKLWRRSMELLATEVMPRFSRHADASPAR